MKTYTRRDINSSKEESDKTEIKYEGVKSVIEFLEAYKVVLSGTNNILQYKIYTRGEHADFFPTNCIPNIYRGTQEFLVDGKESVLYDRLKSSKYMDLSSSNLHIAFEAQHGGLQTRLLDVSENVLISLYFSLVMDKDCKLSNEDGYVYVYKTSTVYENNSMNLIEHIDYLTRGEIKFDDLKNKRREMIFINGNMQNRRISKQQGAFILFYTDDKNYLEEFNKNHLLGRIKVDRDSKKNILEELDNDFGITEHFVYPELFNAADALRKDVTNYYEKFE